ncbi:MAG TPA: protoporphyrinogen oxidase [Pyrinomonadaceae bacterium]|nr:protoporphyrinogen oxidase [Pyrinomonadaceae bacterium]
MKRVLVIGAGITGLAAANRLVELNQTAANRIEVLLLEGSKRLGGIVRTEERDGFLLEHGPDSFLSEKPEVINLAARIGIKSRLAQTNPRYRRSFIVSKGRLCNVPKGFHLLAPSRLWPMITSDIFSWRGKARILLETVVPRRASNGDVDESLADFVRRRLGQEALERIAQPMVGGIYTADPKRLSLRATFPRFLEMESKHGSLIRALRRQREEGAEVSGARYSLFLSFDRGMQVLTDTLAARLPTDLVRTDSKALSIARTAKWHVRTSSGETITANAICITVPSYAAASLLRDFDSRLSSELDNIGYESTATVNLAYKRRDISHALDGFGFVVPAIERRAVIACTFSSIKFAGRAPEDHVLLRAFVGGALQSEFFALETQEILAPVKRDLNELLGITAEPLFTTLTKWQRSMPQYEVGHQARVDRIHDLSRRVRGLELAGNAYSGVGIPDCIRSGEQAAERIWGVLQSN